jgi:hypothetical protein
LDAPIGSIKKPFPRHQNKNKLHMKYQKLRRGTTLLTPITKKWSKEEMERNEETESRMIFTDFSFEDSGRSRKLVCTMNVNHPDYREYRKLIEHSTDLLKVLKDIVAISDRKHDVWDKAHELIRELS